MNGDFDKTSESASNFGQGPITRTNGGKDGESLYTSDENMICDSNETNGESYHHLDTDGRDALTGNLASTKGPSSLPIAICGMACRLPGGIHSPTELWPFLLDGKDARSLVPPTRYNISAFHSPYKKLGTISFKHGYFLDPTNDLGALDTSFFSMPRGEVETLDPQQRLILEVTREALDDAGQTGWKGSNIGVYMGSFGQDWNNISVMDTERYGIYQILTSHDFMISNRVSHELDLRGPSVTVRQACSSSLIAVHEACLAIASRNCPSAIVGGTSILMSPGASAEGSEQGVFSPEGSCNTFSANANGFARGEGIVAIYLKPLADAIRDGNPIRAVITGTAANHNGQTPTISKPSSEAQEALIRQAYRNAGIADIARTGYFECHGTGTKAGDPLETAAVSACFGKAGVHIGSVKPNLGHAEGASGLVSILKAVLALENRTIPPSIKCLPPNPAIPFEDAKLTVPTEPTPWPKDRDERISVNSFGLGGSNAHAIIESAARFNAQPALETRTPGPSTPHLLLFSANTPASLKDIGQKYESFLDRNPQLLPDVAYTLANKREHLPHRGYVVRTSDGISSTISTPSGKVEANRGTSIVMVFTGQGAQWPRMGYELLRSNTNPVFSNTIASLDRALQELGPLAPSWTIDEELRKPARRSRVGDAEFSQPLCTALQIALVETYASVGIRPAVVLGHSSGEIVASYAAGGLSAREAIIVAFLRGLVTKRQSRKGAMAALGLSWEAAKKYLVDGVVVACDNAPNNVTISGDSDLVEQIVRSIKQSDLGVLATLLKVEKAYHSPHMAEIGPEYHKYMADTGVVGNAHSLPFFSSVSGELLAPDGPPGKSKFGPEYWQANLESPVLFASAVSAAINQHVGLSKQVFLEVGPHPALSGPLRQILTQASSNASYVPTLARKANSYESWLSALGQLFSHNVSFDIHALMPVGITLSGLPTYPWDHRHSHWRETRVCHDWRMRKHRHHDLLGAKVLETTDLDPAWRNVLHIENAPWIRDHKINGDIIFPFAGYIAMAAEAIRQITGAEDAVEFRNVSVTTSLVLNEGEPKELVTNFHRSRPINSPDSEWWEFTIASYTGNNWAKHCSGETRAQEGKSPLHNQVAPHAQQDLPRKASKKRWYDAMSRVGLEYGYHFVSLENITTTTTGERGAHAQLRNNWHGDEQFYHIHPVILDASLQLLLIASAYGLTYDCRQMLPSRIGFLTLRRCSANELTISATAELVASGVVGKGTVATDNEPVIKISDVGLTAFTSGDVKEDKQITARSEWVPQIENEVLSTLVTPIPGIRTYTAALNELAILSISTTSSSLGNVDDVIPEFRGYKSWIDETPACSGDSDDSTLNTHIESLAASLASTTVAKIAKAITTVNDNAPAILSGLRKASDILNKDDILGKFNRLLGGFDGSAFFNLLGHNKPNLRVLELHAGIGSATADFVKDLTRADGQFLFSYYVVSDPSPGMVQALQNRFQGLPNMAFEVFDIGKNIKVQGFEEREFDLVIAAGILHATPKLSESLVRARQLLAPSGRLLLQSMRPGLPWTKYVLGLLPDWHIGTDDGREDEPYVDVKSWQELLKGAGLETTGEVAFDSEEPDHTSFAIVARPQAPVPRPKKVTIVTSSPVGTSRSDPITEELLARGYEIFHCSLTAVPPPGQDIIALLDDKRSYLEELNATKLEQLKTFINNMADSGMLWITKPSVSQCSDPGFAQIHGLARCIRSERGIAFATCEADDIESLQGCRAVVRLFSRFSERISSGEVEPDFEYVIENGVTRVHRFFPVSLENHTGAASAAKDARLTIGQPGRFDTLHWREDTLNALQGDEVLVEIHAAGLNTQDILVAKGIIESPTLSFGYEATGIVRRVGPMVEKLQINDRVALLGLGAFSTTVMTTEKMCERIPDDLDFSSGATMPMVFATAIYTLITVGRLEKGQSILIHSGCGGVGLAAIQVARMIGAEVYSTVSSENKIEFLVREFGLSRDHIFNSRDLRFEQELLRETNGKGVDLALNSLSGDFLHSTWRCVSKWGTLIEISNREISSGGKPELSNSGKLDKGAFLANRIYRCIDMFQIFEERPEMVTHLLRSTMDLFRDGDIRAITIDKIFPGSLVQEAIQHVQQGDHIGKVVLELRERRSGELQIGEIQPARTPNMTVLDSSASYLLVGGLGGLGRSIAVWMVQHGARDLIFLSRSAGTTDGDKFFVKEIQSMGCDVRLVRGSVTNITDVARAVAESPRPLKGIIQMTMVLHDQSWINITIDEWNGATAPKVRGTWNLHNETLALDLDFFILFSSLSGVMGQPGQSNYASANTFLDAFVKFRTSKGLPCASLAIGAVEGAGYLAQNDKLLRKMKGIGWTPVHESELLQVLAHFMRRQSFPLASNGFQLQRPLNLLNSDSILVGIRPSIPLSSPDSSAKLRRDVRMLIFHNSPHQAIEGASAEGLRQFLNKAKANPEALSKEDSVNFLSQEIGKKLVGMKLRSVDDKIDVSMSLGQLGLDSMVAVEMREWWKQTFGLDISVLEMLSMGTLESLGKRAAKGLLALYT